jgi:hypothetical protein
MAKRQTTYLVLRFARYTPRRRSVIDEHIAVQRRHGYVAFGKIGKPLSKGRIAALAEQISALQKYKMFLVSTKQTTRAVYTADLIDVMRILPKKYRSSVPTYYEAEKIESVISSWLLLRNIRPSTAFQRGAFVTTTSHSDLVDALDRSIAGFFIVSRTSKSHDSAG